jgi:hypothetical protein
MGVLTPFAGSAVVLALAAVFTVLGRIIDNWAVARFTIVNDLKRLGQPRARKLRGTAVICGGR